MPPDSASRMARMAPGPADWSKPAPRPLIRRHSGIPVLLTFVYVVLLVAPWTIISILSVRLLNGLSYDDRGGNISPADFDQAYMAWKAAVVLSQAAAVLTIPVTSAVIAQCAVVYLQRGSGAKSLNLGQAFGFADRGWADPLIMLTNRMRHARSFPLWLAFLYTTLVFVIQLLQKCLVGVEPVNSVTCDIVPFNGYNYNYADYAIGHRNLNHCPYRGRYRMIARDRYLGDICTQTIDDESVASLYWRLVYARQEQVLANEWGKLPDYAAGYMGNEPFLSGSPAGITTGALSGQATRMNSSVICTPAAFPATCSGDNPLVFDFTTQGSTGAGTNGGTYRASICIPGDYRQSPWNLTRNRQTLTEDVYLSFTNSVNDAAFDRSLHCTAKTDLGLFRLGNVWTSNVPGPLIDQQADDPRVTYANEFLPVESCNAYARSPIFHIGSPRTSFGPYSVLLGSNATLAPGPLALSMYAIFGNYSWLAAGGSFNSTNLTSINATYARPNMIRGEFYPLQDYFDQGNLTNMASVGGYLGNASERVVPFFQQFFGLKGNSSDTMVKILQEALRHTSDFMLTGPTGQTKSYIYQAEPASHVKPKVALGSIVAVAILLGVQVLGLLFAVVYAVRHKTWTRTLDAFALVRMGASLQRERPGAGDSAPPLREWNSKKDRKWLEGMPGVVGVMELGQGDSGALATGVRLGLGGTGPVNRFPDLVSQQRQQGAEENKTGSEAATSEGDPSPDRPRETPAEAAA